MRIYAVISAWGEYETDLCGLWYFDFGSNGNDAQFSQPKDLIFSSGWWSVVSG